MRRYAAELVALAPDVILASGGFGMGPLQQATRTVPIVFVNVTDPVCSKKFARKSGSSKPQFAVVAWQYFFSLFAALCWPLLQ